MADAPDRRELDVRLPVVYEELRRLAAAYLSRERDGHTLQPTALVHEAYLKLIDQREVDWSNRAHFLGVAALAMRRVLLVHAEKRRADKRGGESTRVALDAALEFLEKQSEVDFVDLDRALTNLAALDARQAQIVELRCFAGLTIEETAEALELSPATVKRDWTVARLWLRRELQGQRR